MDRVARGEMWCGAFSGRGNIESMHTIKYPVFKALAPPLVYARLFIFFYIVPSCNTGELHVHVHEFCAMNILVSFLCSDVPSLNIDGSGDALTCLGVIL